MNNKYILDKNHVPILCIDLMEWARQFQTADRSVANDYIGESQVSTVFLGLDQNWGDGKPILWETMVFGGAMDGEQDRCAGLWEDALEMHERMIKKVRKANDHMSRT